MATDKGFQTFLCKATKIIAIFLKDKAASHELYRAVLTFLRMSLGLLEQSSILPLGKEMIHSIFSERVDKSALQKHRLLVRKIVSKLIGKLGEAQVRKMMPATGRDLISYIERMKRKASHKKEREILSKCLGSLDQPDEKSDSESDSSESDVDDLKE